MIISRNAVMFLKRKGLTFEPARPRPRLDLKALLVHTVPLASPPKPVQGVLQTYEGDPSPDRGISRAWPGQTEE